MIYRALDGYRNAFRGLNAGAAREVWPTVNERALERAFDRLEEQDLMFERCQVTVDGGRGEASCTGTARYIPKIGGRSARVERREWRFQLRQASGRWVIESVEAR